MTEPRTWRYLTITGAFPWWQSFILLLLAVFGFAEYAWSGRGETGLILSLALFPVFMGTGLLHSARQGRLDLLMGAGESRTGLYWKAAARAFALPLVLAVTLLQLSQDEWTAMETVGRVVRGLSVVALTGGVCFAAGLVQPAYLAGCLWIFLRLVGLLLPAARVYLSEFEIWTKGGPAPAAWKTALAVLMVPELAIERTVPLLLAFCMASIGIAGLLLAARRFRSADFAGKRQE